MSERERLLREIQVREELLALYGRLRELDSKAPPTPWPGASPNKANPQPPPASFEDGLMDITMACGPNGAVEPDLTALEHVIRKKFRAKEGRDPGEAEVVSILGYWREKICATHRSLLPGQVISIKFDP